MNKQIQAKELLLVRNFFDKISSVSAEWKEIAFKIDEEKSNFLVIKITNEELLYDLVDFSKRDYKDQFTKSKILHFDYNIEDLVNQTNLLKNQEKIKVSNFIENEKGTGSAISYLKLANGTVHICSKLHDSTMLPVCNMKLFNGMIDNFAHLERTKPDTIGTNGLNQEVIDSKKQFSKRLMKSLEPKQCKISKRKTNSM